MKNVEEQKKIDDLMAAAMLADESGKVMNGVNPHSILALFDLLREQTNRAVTSEVKFKEILAAEHRLSDAYIRIREICGTIFLPPGSDIWKETEKSASAMAKSYAQLAGLAKQEPDYFLNRIESSDKWGPETDLRIYESQLGASKSQDDHGGGIIELFTRAAPAVAPDGWKLVPVQPTDDMLQAWRNDMSNSYASQYAENIGDDEIVFAHQAMLEAAPTAVPVDDLDAKRLAFIASMQDETAPEQYESLRKGE